VWKSFTDLFDYLPLTALVENQVRHLFASAAVKRKGSSEKERQQ